MRAGLQEYCSAIRGATLLLIPPKLHTTVGSDWKENEIWGVINN